MFCVGIIATMLASANFEEPNVVHYTDLNKEVSIAFMHEKKPQVIIAVHKGDQLPLSIATSGDLLHTEGSGTIEVQQNIYLKYENQEFYFSTDLETFKPFFEFLTGNLNIGLYDGTLVCEVDVNER